MTANLTATTAQAQIDDALRQAHEHRLAHEFELERLSRRWFPALRLRAHSSRSTALTANNVGR